MNQLALALLLLTVGADYQQVDQVDGITVESRPVEGSKFAEFRFIATSPKPIDALCEAAFGDGTIDPAEGEVKSRKVLESKPDERLTYDEITSPIVSNRDYALRLKRTREPGGACVISYAAANEAAPPLRSGWVRIEKLWGGWRFEARNGKTQATYVTFAEPGGSIPAFIAEGGRRKSALRWVQRVLEKAKAR